MCTKDCVTLVAACGIYCGNCSKYKKGNCPGCTKNDKASWCKIRICTKESGYITCAECKDYSDVYECGKFNTFLSKVFAFIFKSDRKASIKRIEEIGPDAYAEEMDASGKPVIKKK